MTDLDDAVPPQVGQPMIDLLAGFIVELRSAGIPVSLTENLDAMRAVEHIPLEDREAFKYALAATMVKNHAHWRAFETVFEVYFSLRGKQYALDADAEGLDLGDLDDLDAADMEGQGDQQGMGGAGGGEPLTPEQLAEMLYQALMDGNEAMLRALARQAVRRYAGMEPGRPVGGPARPFLTDTCRGRRSSTCGRDAENSRRARSRP